MMVNQVDVYSQPLHFLVHSVYKFRIKKVFVGEDETFAGAWGFMVSHGVEVINLNLDGCKQLMKEFIRKDPELWNEDIGEL